MARVAPAQPDLFVSACPEPPSPLPLCDPLGELQALLATVQAASVLPWPDVTAAMIEEHRALWLAGQAGTEGTRLAAAIFKETERLFAAAE